MNQSLIAFQFESLPIRSVVIKGAPQFGARDVALALAYADPSQAYRQHCKSLILLSSVECTELGWVNPNPRGEYVMPESDVYRLIVKSEKPEAERFEKWLFEEVLPSIRKTGSYSIPNTSKLSREERYRLGVFRDAVKTAQLIGFVGNMASLSADNYCKATLGCSVLESFGATHLIANKRGKTFTPTELGKLCVPALSAVKFNRALEAAGLQRHELGYWIPTDAANELCEWSDTAKRHHDGSPVKQLKWFIGVLENVSWAVKDVA